MRNKIFLIHLLSFLFLGISFTFGQETKTEKEKFADLARQQFDKGTAIIETAQSIEDFKLAIKEFESALTTSMYGGIYLELRSSIYYNLGLLYENIEDFDKADYYLTLYIVADPPPDDVEEVKMMLKNIQHKSDQFVNPQTLEGIWYYSVPRESSEPRLEIRYNNNKAILEARCLTSEAWEGKIPEGEFVKAQWDIFEKKLTIIEATYNTCDKSVDANWCPHKVTLNLLRTGVNKLEGELSDTGIIYQDMNNPEMFTSSGKVIFERQIE